MCFCFFLVQNFYFHPTLLPSRIKEVRKIDGFDNGNVGDQLLRSHHPWALWALGLVLGTSWWPWAGRPSDPFSDFLAFIQSRIKKFLFMEGGS